MDRHLGSTPPSGYWIDEAAHPERQSTGTSLRIRSLDETERLAELALGSAGVTRIADVTELDRVGIDVFHTVRPTAMPGLNTVTSGKGTTKQAARVSALMEALERRWCEPPGTGLTVASFLELTESGKDVLDPRRLIPRRSHTWTPSSKLTWFPARDLVSDRQVFVPALSVFTPFEHEAGLFSSNTIGLAIGNSPREALLHGLLELIEHDSTAFGETLRRGYSVDAATIPVEAQRLVTLFNRADVDVDIFSYETETGIPTFQVTTSDRRMHDGMLFNGGVGCHLDPEIALMRALTEAAQSRLNVIAGAREDFDRQAYRRHTSYQELKAHYDQWRSGRPSIPFTVVANRSTGTLEGELEVVLESLRSANVNAILVAELAPGNYPFSVTKVIVPGLEVFHEDRQRIGPRLSRTIRELKSSQEVSL